MNDQSIVVRLRQRSLTELLDILPDRVMIERDVVKFALSKDSDKQDGTTLFTCYGLHAFGSGYEPFFHKGGKMEFSSNDPAIAISMMIGYLRAEKIIS